MKNITLKNHRCLITKICIFCESNINVIEIPSDIFWNLCFVGRVILIEGDNICENCLEELKEGKEIILKDEKIRIKLKKLKVIKNGCK